MGPLVPSSPVKVALLDEASNKFPMDRQMLLREVDAIYVKFHTRISVSEAITLLLLWKKRLPLSLIM